MIPKNFLAEGRIMAHVTINSLDPNLIHAEVKDAVAFQVVDREDVGGNQSFCHRWPGVIRPKLDWTTREERGIFRVPGKSW